LALGREAYFQSLKVVQFMQYSTWRKEKLMEDAKNEVSEKRDTRAKTPRTTKKRGLLGAFARE